MIERRFCLSQENPYGDEWYARDSDLMMEDDHLIGVGLSQEESIIDLLQQYIELMAIEIEIEAEEEMKGE